MYIMVAMYHLHQTDNLEAAAIAHAHLLEADPDAPPTLVIVQSAHMQRWLSLVLSRRRGIWFRPDFTTPDSGLRRLLAHMRQGNGETPPRTLFMDDLKYLSFRTLGSFARAGNFSSEFPVLAQLLAPESGAQSSQSVNPSFSRQRLYELADTLAGVFFGYSQLFWSAASGGPADNHLFRLWESGISLFQNSDLATTEEWQRKLYLHMFPAGRGYDILGYQTYRAAAERWSYEGPYRRIVLFGSAFLSSQSFGFFRMLAETGMEIHHVALTPSPSLEARPTVFAVLPQLHPLSDWSSLLQPFIEDATQSSIKKTASFERNIVPIPSHFRMFSCTTPLREVQALKQNLLALMTAQRDTARPLLLQEIAIMAPDIRHYRPWLEACFPSLDENGRALPDHLSLNIVDLDFGSGSIVVTALERLFSLGSSRLERSTVLEILDNPAIRLAIGIDEAGVESFANWSAAYEVRWGLNAEHRKNMEAGESWSNTWDKALLRLFEDLACDSGDIGSAEIETIGRVADYLHGVIETLHSWENTQKDLATWVRELRFFLDLRLQAPSEAETKILDQVRGAAGNLLQIARDLGELNTQKDELDWTGFRILFNDQIAHLSGGKGQHQIDGITCSSLRPYRAIPFRLIALLGMNEGALPRKDAVVSFDLSRNSALCRGLITNRIQDNYAWLETLVSAREFLWIFYAGRDASSGEKLACAPMVEETMQVVSAQSSERAPDIPLLVEERIVGFDREYFTPSGAAQGLVSTSAADFNIARAMDHLISAAPTAHRSPTSEPRFFGPVNDDDLAFLKGKDGLGLSVTLKDLNDFVINPIQSHVQVRLGIRQSRTEGADVESLDLANWLPHQAVGELAQQIQSLSGDADSGARELALLMVDQEQARDALFDSPFADRARTSLSVSLGLVEDELRQLLSNTAAVPTKGEQDFEIEHVVHVALPNKSPDNAVSKTASAAVKLRLRGSLDSLWHFPDGPAWVVVGTKAAKSASGIQNKHFFSFALARALCRLQGSPIPERLIYVGLHSGEEGASQILELPALDLGEQELSLAAILDAWVLNLVHPLPFYMALTKELLFPLSKKERKPEDQDIALEDHLIESWQRAWKASMEKADFLERTYGVPEKAVHCASWKLLNPNSFDAPPFQEWYVEPLSTVWLPLWHRRSSFMSGYRSKAKQGKKA